MGSWGSAADAFNNIALRKANRLQKAAQSREEWYLQENNRLLAEILAQLTWQNQNTYRGAQR